MSAVINSLKALAALGCLVVYGCSSPATNVAVTFDPEGASLAGQPVSALKLVVEINSHGDLTLNRIETGTVADPALLAERLRAIFEDRRKASIGEREVLIEMEGSIRREDLDRLISTLAKAHVSAIKVTRKATIDAELSRRDGQSY